MKKLVLTAALMAAMSAQALEVGVTTNRDYANADRNGFGLTVGQKFNKVGVTAGFDRITNGNDLDRFSLVSSYDVAKVGSATIAVKAGAAYLNQSGPKTKDGYAALVGAGVSMPLTKAIAATVDYRYQVGQSRVEKLDGGMVSAGLKFTF